MPDKQSAGSMVPIVGALDLSLSKPKAKAKPTRKPVRVAHTSPSGTTYTYWYKGPGKPTAKFIASTIADAQAKEAKGAKPVDGGFGASAKSQAKPKATGPAPAERLLRASVPIPQAAPEIDYGAPKLKRTPNVRPDQVRKPKAPTRPTGKNAPKPPPPNTDEGMFSREEVLRALVSGEGNGTVRSKAGDPFPIERAVRYLKKRTGEDLQLTISDPSFDPDTLGTQARPNMTDGEAMGNLFGPKVGRDVGFTQGQRQDQVATGKARKALAAKGKPPKHLKGSALERWRVDQKVKSLETGSPLLDMILQSTPGVVAEQMGAEVATVTDGDESAGTRLGALGNLFGAGAASYLLPFAAGKFFKPLLSATDAKASVAMGKIGAYGDNVPVWPPSPSAKGGAPVAGVGPAPSPTVAATTAGKTYYQPGKGRTSIGVAGGKRVATKTIRASAVKRAQHSADPLGELVGAAIRTGDVAPDQAAAARQSWEEAADQAAAVTGQTRDAWIRENAGTINVAEPAPVATPASPVDLQSSTKAPRAPSGPAPRTDVEVQRLREGLLRMDIEDARLDPEHASFDPRLDQALHEQLAPEGTPYKAGQGWMWLDEMKEALAESGARQTEEAMVRRDSMLQGYEEIGAHFPSKMTSDVDDPTSLVRWYRRGGRWVADKRRTSRVSTVTGDQFPDHIRAIIDEYAATHGGDYLLLDAEHSARLSLKGTGVKGSDRHPPGALTTGEWALKDAGNKAQRYPLPLLRDFARDHGIPLKLTDKDLVIAVANASELPPAKPTLPTTKRADVSALRREVGLPDYTPTGRSWDEAAEASYSNGDLKDADAIAQSILKKPRPATDSETMALLIRGDELARERTKLGEKYAAAVQKGDAAGAHVLEQKLAEIDRRMLDHADALDISGSEAGRSLNARKALLKEEYTREAMAQRGVRAVRGPLEPKVATELELHAKRIAQLERQLEDAGKRPKPPRPTPEQLQAGLKAIHQQRREAIKSGALNARVTVDKYELAKKQLAGSANALFTSDQLGALRTIAEFHIERGVMAVDELVRELRGVLPKGLEGVEDGDLHAVLRDAAAAHARTLNRGRQFGEDFLQRGDSAIQSPEVATLRKQLGALREELKVKPDPVLADAIEEMAEKLEELAGMVGQDLDLPRYRQLRADIGKLGAKLNKGRGVGDDFLEAGDNAIQTPEIEALRDQLDTAKANADRYVKGLAELADYDESGLLAKAGRQLVDVAGTVPRTLKTMADMSAPFRQGAFFALSRPGSWLKAWAPMLRTSISQAKYDTMVARMRKRDHYALGERAGLHLQDMDVSDDLSTGALKDRLLGSMFLEKAPGVSSVKRFSERSYSAFINTLRVEVFDSFVEKAIASGQPLSLDEAKAVANYVNIATGRGDLGNLAGAGQELGVIFFAPRYTMSRWQLLNPLSSANPLRKGSARTRAAMAKDYAAFMGLGVGALKLAELAGAEVEWDPRSSDFGKIRIGETRIDLLGGILQPAVLTSQLAAGKKAPKTGKVTHDFGNTIGDYLRGKAAPLPSSIVTGLEGKDPTGKKATPGSMAVDFVEPLAIKNLRENVGHSGLAKGLAFAASSFFGMEASPHTPRGPQIPLSKRAGSELKRLGYFPEAKGDRHTDAAIAEDVEKLLSGGSDFRTSLEYGKDLWKANKAWSAKGLKRGRPYSEQTDAVKKLMLKTVVDRARERAKKKAAREKRLSSVD